jgi:CheY-like chemotaxis protein
MQHVPVVAVINTSPDTVEMLTELFEHHGFVVVSTYTHVIRTGEFDLRAFLDQHRPDVVLYDIAPPYDRNWRFFLHLRETTIGDLPCVLTSTNVAVVRSLIDPQLTIFEIVEKPYYMEQIVTAVRRLLGHAVPQDRSA